MNKSELRQNLQNTCELWRGIDEINNENNELRTSDLGYCIMFFGGGITILGYLIYVLWNASDNNIFIMLASCIYYIVKGFIPVAIILIIIYVIHLVLNKYECIKNAVKIQENNSKKNNIANNIRRMTVVPESYININYIRRFIQYIDNQRADNLKECINLLEEEFRHNEKMKTLKENRDIALENQRILNNIDANIYYND